MLVADWPLISLGAILGGAGLLLLARGLFRDPGAGVRRCPRCWYEMVGVPGCVCPECGREAATERGLFKRRRSWRLAMLGFVLVLSGTIMATPGLRRDGLFGLVPFRALVAMLPPLGPNDAVLLFNSPSQRTPAWTPADEISRRIARDGLTSDYLKALMKQKGVLVVRDRYDAGAPIWIEFRRPFWLDLSTTVRVSMVGSDWAPLHLGEGEFDSFGGMPSTVCTGEIGIAPDVGEEVEIEVSATRRYSTGGEVCARMTLPVRIVKPAVVRPVPSPLIERYIDAHLFPGAGATVWDKDRHVLLVFLLLEHANDEPETKAAAGVLVELLRDGAPVGSGRLLLSRGLTSADLADRAEIDLAPDVYGQLMATRTSPRWSVRISGDAQASARDMTATRFWAWSRELPLSSLWGLTGTERPISDIREGNGR